MRAGLTTLCVLLHGMATAQAGQPNLLLLVAEDLSPRMGAYGDSLARTPNADSLARRGVRYTAAFTTAGVCAPSRAALIMGQHQIAFAAQHMRTTTGPLGPYLARPPEDLKAFPELLRRAGYYTFTDGKLDYQFSGVRAGSGPFSLWDDEGPTADWTGRRPDQPFFGLINFMETHESGVMRMDTAPLSESHRQTQAFRRGAGLVAPSVTDPGQVVLPPYYPDAPAVREDIARHYDNIAAMDVRLGRLLQRLARDGLSESTIVVLTSDHGDGLPRSKRELFDSGVSVPLIVYVPPRYRRSDWHPGSSRADLVSFVDLAPTLLRWAGVVPPASLHGVDIERGERRYVYASRDRIDEVMDRQRAVRDRRYKYIVSWYPDLAGGHPLEYRDNLAMVRAWRTLYLAGSLSPAQRRWFEAPGAEQLYDLQTDPYELDNRVSDPSLARVRVRLRRALIDWLIRVGDSGRMSEADLRARLLANGEIPRTPAPEACLDEGRPQARSGHGASIGYRIDGSPWRLYPPPEGRIGGPLEVKAVRYGWRESPVVTASTCAP